MKNTANGGNASGAGGESASSAKPVPAGTPAGSIPRRRLRMQPLAHDHFMTFVYACVIALMVFEFVALFWLDLFD